MTSSTHRERRDPRREAARIALIEAAETLIAEASVESVSVRQIGAAIGSGNNGVVAYYFGTKEALVEAIYLHRQPALEQRRAALLAEAEANGTAPDISALLRVLCLPLLEQTNAEGRHSYAGFLASVSRSGWLQTWEALNEEYPVTREIIGRLKDAVPDEARAIFAPRLRISIGMITNALAMIDQNIGDGNKEFAFNIFDDALVMITTALCSRPQGLRPS